MGKVRVINKSGKVLLVAEHIANNAKRLKSYGFIKQDFEERKEEVVNPEFKEAETTPAKGKPGRKKRN